MQKTAPTDHPIHELLAERWSPLSFDARAVSTETLGSLFEAARWAPSCFNEQPWTFFVARREDGTAFERLARCLVPGNALWATRAPVLALSVAKLAFERNGKANRHAYHDVGLATANLIVEAESRGLRVHAMGGFDPEHAREQLAIPAGHDPVAMLALGYQGDVHALAASLVERELAPRSRKPQREFVFGGRWGESAAF
jgi:nitroreductase